MGTIYHYTNQAGLTGILSLEEDNNNDRIKLWFTRADCLNDASEGVDLTRVFETAIKRLSDSNIITEKQSNALTKLKFDSPTVFLRKDPTDENAFQSLECEADVYICSFSEGGDELDLWRYYSKGSIGYALGFEKTTLEIKMEDNPLLNPEIPIWKVLWQRVIYDDSEKLKIIEGTVQGYLSLFDGEDDTSLQNLCKAVEFSLSPYKFQFKHPCFTSEKEIRGIIIVPNKTIDLQNGHQPIIKERLSFNGIIPYIEQKYDIMALDSIMVSPLANKNAVHITQEYIDKFLNGSSNTVVVEQSNLPVRF